jgi:Fe-S-cluster-containing dehydrogenase component
MLACPVDAISKDHDSGVVLKDNDICIGCKMCMMVCPFGGPSFDHVEKKVVMCDLCEGNPMCARLCPTGAIQFLEADSIGLMKKRQGIKQLANLVTLAVGDTTETEGGK